MTSAAGVLLVGPPGCGKTSVARVRIPHALKIGKKHFFKQK